MPMATPDAEISAVRFRCVLWLNDTIYSMSLMNLTGTYYGIQVVTLYTDLERPMHSVTDRRAEDIMLLNRYIFGQKP